MSSELRVRILTAAAGAFGNLVPGQVVTLPRPFALSLVRAHAAVSLDGDAGEVEVALAPEPVERAVVERPRKRRGGARR